MFTPNTRYMTYLFTLKCSCHSLRNINWRYIDWDTSGFWSSFWSWALKTKSSPNF